MPLPEASERGFMDAVIQLARLCGWMVYHTFDSRRSMSGFPDLVLARGGVVVFAELKAEKGKTSPDQDAWLLALRGEVAAVSNVHVWRPSDWPTIEALLMGKPTGQVIDTVAPDELP